MLACSTCAMGVRRYCCSSPECSHSRFFVKPVNPKPAVRVASKAPNSGLPSSAIFCRIANGNILPSLCLNYFGLFLTITGTCSTNSFAVQPAPYSNTPSAKASKLAFFVRCILTVANSINIRIFIYPSRVGGLTQYDTWKPIFFKKKDVEKVWRSAVIRLLRDNYFQLQPNKLPGFGHIRNYQTWCRYLNAQFQRYWKVHFAKKTRGAWHNVKYLGRYLKRPPISASQLKHYSGGTVVHHYYDHHSQQYRRQTLSQEEMIRRYVSHIPARHFKMIRYYGFF
ncbi:Putative transposase (plasmid) [Arsenophonus nasoniae]|uniref:Transposase n=1 Tax=Arsenophonus nasoniae TaxID=638 RepID=A0A4P7L4E9_9GAMM|nr:Putative transposase [Arsenophonus nasoniae]